jgi:hypothetical protein
VRISNLVFLDVVAEVDRHFERKAIAYCSYYAVGAHSKSSDCAEIR